MTALHNGLVDEQPQLEQRHALLQLKKFVAEQRLEEVGDKVASIKVEEVDDLESYDSVVDYAVPDFELSDDTRLKHHLEKGPFENC